MVDFWVMVVGMGFWYWLVALWFRWGCLFAVIADGDLLGFGFGGEFLIVLVLRFL